MQLVLVVPWSMAATYLDITTFLKRIGLLYIKILGNGEKKADRDSAFGIDIILSVIRCDTFPPASYNSTEWTPQ